MSKIVDKCLTDTLIKSSKHLDKAYKLRDGGGLILFVSKTSKIWRLEYNIGDSRNTYTIGYYPEISLSKARIKREELKALVRQGVDINKLKQEEKQATAEQEDFKFQNIAESWLGNIKGSITDSFHRKKQSALEKNIYPYIGDRQIADIKRADIIECISRIQDRGSLEMAIRVFDMLQRIWKFAVTKGATEHNITADIPKKDTFKTPKANNYPFIKDYDRLGQLLRDIDGYKGKSISVKYALKLAPYVFVRPDNITRAQWSEFDFEKAVWKIPAEKMKMKAPHIVPLSTQVIELLKELKTFTHYSEYLFPSDISRSKTLSNNTLNHALKNLGYDGEIVTHGFRHVASTILHEHISEHGFHSDIIERQMAHGERNDVKAAYNHAQHLRERKELMQWYADFLDDIKTKG